MSHPSRREFLQAVVAGAVGATFTYRTAFGQGAPPPITATKLSPSVVLLSGDGGNVALVLAPDGLMLVDGGLPERAADLLKAVTDVDAHKITTVFNTHWHFDHIGCNETLGKSGAKIIAHENVKKRLGMRVTMEALNRTFEPLKPEGQPSQTFAKNGKMTFGKESIEYAHVDPAHTDGDSYVFFPGPNVLHTGDLLFTGTYPVIDYSTGGWLGGMIAAADTMMKVGDANTKIIPGHGALSTRADLKASHDMMSGVRDRLAPLVKQGKSPDEVVASKPTKDLDEKWGKGFMTPDLFVRAAYVSLQRHG
jgi:glyoxylase-like metal-dependent hydrolase (beta-lactamase superfamily II)